MRRPLVLAIALALAGTTLQAAAQAPSPGSAPEVRATTQLPRNVRPTHYEVAVVPHATSLTFDGNAVIGLDVLDPTASITLNALDMAFASSTLSPLEGGAAIPAKITID